METRELDYDLPPELIAQHPAERRDESRLLVFDRTTGAVQHRVFRELAQLVQPLTVVNDTRVVPARIAIEKPRGEVLLLERLDGEDLEAADATVEQEANATAEIAWLAHRLPEPEVLHIQELCRSYAEEVVHKE